MVQSKNKVTDSEILDIYNQKDINLHEAAAILKMTNVSLWRRASKIGLKWKDKKIHTGGPEKILLSEILEGKYPSYQTFKLKKRLIKEGLKENQCEECKIREWNGKPLSMQLDHIDGNPHNHLWINLKLLCPNCHSQTETFCGKNK